MYYNSTEYKTLAILNMQCPICGETSNIKIAREEDFISLLIIFNFWLFGKLIGTCGNCHESFKFDKNEMFEILESVDISVKRSNIKKNILSVSIPIIIIYILVNI